MLINVDYILKDLQGENLKDEKGVDVIARKIIINALSSVQDEGASGEDKLKRYKLATRLIDGGEQELTAEEISTIKTLVNKGWGAPLIVGQIFTLLESAVTPKEVSNGADSN